MSKGRRVQMTTLAIIRKLSQSEGAVFVEHEPRTEAYVRAEEELHNLITYAEEIGRGEVHEKNGIDERPVNHVVVWLSPLNPGECGTYGVFKICSDEYGPYEAVLFAFYDGRQNRQGWKSISEAKAWMRQNHPEYIEV
jgi:hypothetical protein